MRPTTSSYGPFHLICQMPMTMPSRYPRWRTLIISAYQLFSSIFVDRRNDRANCNNESSIGDRSWDRLEYGNRLCLPRNTTSVLATLMSLTVTCSGLNGICVGPATPSATGRVTSTASSALLPAATSTATGDAGRPVSRPDHALILLGGLVLAMLERRQLSR
jgi:hypothetical protein